MSKPLLQVRVPRVSRTESKLDFVAILHKISAQICIKWWLTGRNALVMPVTNACLLPTGHLSWVFLWSGQEIWTCSSSSNPTFSGKLIQAKLRPDRLLRSVSSRKEFEIFFHENLFPLMACQLDLWLVLSNSLIFDFVQSLRDFDWLHWDCRMIHQLWTCCFLAVIQRVNLNFKF